MVSNAAAIADLDLIRKALRDQPDALAEFEKHIGNDRDALGFALAANIGPIRVHAIEGPHPESVEWHAGYEVGRSEAAPDAGLREAHLWDATCDTPPDDDPYCHCAELTRAALASAPAGRNVPPTTTAADMPCFACGTPWRVTSAYREGALAAAPERTVLDVERLARALHLVGPYHHDHHIEGVPQPCEELASNIAAAYGGRDGLRAQPPLASLPTVGADTERGLYATVNEALISKFSPTRRRLLVGNIVVAVSRWRDKFRDCGCWRTDEGYALCEWHERAFRPQREEAERLGAALRQQGEGQ